MICMHLVNFHISQQSIDFLFVFKKIPNEIDHIYPNEITKVFVQMDLSA